MQKLLAIQTLIIFFLSNSYIAAQPSEKQPLRNKIIVNETFQQKEQDVKEAFSVIPNNSHIKSFCAHAADDYHCRQLTRILYCIQICSENGQQTSKETSVYCKGSALNEDTIMALANDAKLTPQQTIAELKIFFNAVNK